MNRKTQRYVNRMNNVVRALEKAPNPDDFDMALYGYSTEDKCGSPACTLGHYAFRRDLQKTFLLQKDGNLTLRNDNGLGAWVGDASPHFGITFTEAIDLFDIDGCNDAGTDRKQAIKYIANFIKQKWGESPQVLLIDDVDYQDIHSGKI